MVRYGSPRDKSHTCAPYYYPKSRIFRSTIGSKLLYFIGNAPTGFLDQSDAAHPARRLSDLGDCQKRIYADCAVILFGFKAQWQAHSERCNCYCNVRSWTIKTSKLVYSLIEIALGPVDIWWKAIAFQLVIKKRRFAKNFGSYRIPGWSTECV